MRSTISPPSWPPLGAPKRRHSSASSTIAVGKAAAAKEDMEARTAHEQRVRRINERIATARHRISETRKLIDYAEEHGTLIPNYGTNPYTGESKHRPATPRQRAELTPRWAARSESPGSPHESVYVLSEGTPLSESGI